MEHSNISNYYVKFIENLCTPKKVDFNLENKEISKAIFKEIFQIKLANWKLRHFFNRKKKSANSDLFQNIIAYYLKSYLPKEFEVILEEKKEKLQPDILIKFEDNNLFIIEIKTSLGWARNSIDTEIPNRIEKLANAFKINEKNIVYILESPWNVNLSFLERYWNKETKKPNTPPKKIPYSQIRPLMVNDDPFYFKEDRKNKPEEAFAKYDNDSEIDKLAKKSIVVPLELTIKEIIMAAEQK